MGRLQCSGGRWLAVAMAAGAACLAATPAAALAAGGASIATAPPLPLDQQTQSGWVDDSGGEPFGEYWRLPMGAGDRLTFDIGVTQTQCAGGDRAIDVYGPDVTDYTVDRTSPAAEHDWTFNDKDEFVWTAPADGDWTLFILGCWSFSYEFTATVQHPTTVTLQAPQLATARRRVHLRGSVPGVSAGQVELTVTAPRRKPETQLVRIHSDGSFRRTERFTRPGKCRVQARYFGDAHHLQSSARASIRILPGRPPGHFLQLVKQPPHSDRIIDYRYVRHPRKFSVSHGAGAVTTIGAMHWKHWGSRRATATVGYIRDCDRPNPAKHAVKCQTYRHGYAVVSRPRPYLCPVNGRMREMLLYTHDEFHAGKFGFSDGTSYDPVYFDAGCKKP